MKRASKSKFPFAIIVLLAFQMANAAVTYEEGQNKLLFGDIDAAIEIFDNLALFGDNRAAAASEQLRSLSIDERQQYVSQIAAGALESGNLNEAERLYTLLRVRAAERGDKESVDVFAQVLTLIASAKEQAAVETPLAEMRCETILSIQSGSIGNDAAESCAANAPESLIEKHRGEVAAARSALAESGETDGSVLIITEEPSQ
jgi:hypothetical protein